MNSRKAMKKRAVYSWKRCIECLLMAVQSEHGGPDIRCKTFVTLKLRQTCGETAKDWIV